MDDLNINTAYSLNITGSSHTLLAADNKLMIVDMATKRPVVQMEFPVMPLEAVCLIRAYIPDASEEDRQKVFSKITTDMPHCQKFGDPDCICAPARTKAIRLFEELTIEQNSDEETSGPTA